MQYAGQVCSVRDTHSSYNPGLHKKQLIFLCEDRLLGTSINSQFYHLVFSIVTVARRQETA